MTEGPRYIRDLSLAREADRQARLQRERDAFIQQQPSRFERVYCSACGQGFADMPPRENLFFGAGILAGVFALAVALDWTPPAEADTHAAQQARQELRTQAAAQKACEPGSFAVWLDPTSIECRKEVTP